jgi:peptide chain release factor 2
MILEQRSNHYGTKQLNSEIIITVQPIQQESKLLKTDIEKSIEKIGLSNLLDHQADLTAKSKQKNFWDKPEEASRVMRMLSGIEKRTENWLSLKTEISDLEQLIFLDDEKLLPDLEKQLTKIKNEYEDLKAELKFDGPFDDHNAILSIYAGAGGTDAQDWTQMLLKMYVRWAEQHDYETKTISEAPGDEAGLKGVTIEIRGDYIYGKLRGEHGVHRLVRLSPFNSNHLRETSFSKVEVLPLIDSPSEVDLDEKDIQIDVYRSGGHGGQSVNTTDSAVRITHVPSGISVAIQNERSQLQNKETALTILRSRLAQLKLEQHQSNLREIKGPSQSAEWGNQIRSYVLHPYKQVKDSRTHYETSDIDAILKGDLDPMINSFIESNLKI